jgi:hypothetical protein
MTIPADSLPGDHLRPQEYQEGREALRHFLKEHPAPISDQPLLARQLSASFADNAVGAVCLTEKEFTDCREDLCRFIHGEIADPLVQQSFAARMFNRLEGLSRRFALQTVAACCILVVLGNSVAFAAEEALPGDSLYAVKVNIVEPVRAFIAVTPEAKAQWASDCVRRRLVEAERLIADDQLTPETWKTLSESIARQTQAAETQIIRLSKKYAPRAAEISAGLHLALDAHGQVFGAVAQLEGGDAVTSAATDLSAAAAQTAILAEQTEESAAADAASVEQTVTRVLESASSAAFSLDGSTSSVSPTVLERADAARELLKSAEEHRKAGALRESLKDARKAVQKAEEGKAFVRMRINFDNAGKKQKDASPVSSVAAATASSTSSLDVSSTSSNVQMSSPSSSSSVESSQLSLPLPVELPENVPDLPGL